MKPVHATADTTHVVGVRAEVVRLCQPDGAVVPYVAIAAHGHTVDGRCYQTRMMMLTDDDLTWIIRGATETREALRYLDRHPHADIDEVADHAAHRLAMIQHASWLFLSEGNNVSPDCRDGKHPACAGTAWDFDLDELVQCGCACHAGSVLP